MPDLAPGKLIDDVRVGPVCITDGDRREGEAAEHGEYCEDGAPFLSKDITESDLKHPCCSFWFLNTENTEHTEE